MTTKIYVGIDPGKSGGLVAITPNGWLLDPMPDTEGEIWDWFDSLSIDPEPEIYAVIERVASSPQMGVRSAFTFGQGYGTLRMALTSRRVTWVDVTPQSWMKALHIPQGKSGTKKKDQKLKLKKFARQLYPNLPVWNWGIGKQDAVCDAVLIAHYCKMYFGNLIEESPNA